MKVGLREIVFLVLLVAIPVGSWQWIFRPRALHNDLILQEIQVRQEKLRELNKATATIGNLKKEIVSLQEAINFFQSKLPNEKEIDKVLREVWLVAEANNVVTKSIRVLKRGRQELLVGPSGPQEQVISMELYGDFMGFYAFLQAMENQPRIMRIQKMTLATPADSSPGMVQANLILSIFFEKTGRDNQWPKI